MIGKWRPSWSAILDFWIFPNLQESANIERKVTETKKGTVICTKNIKITEEMWFSSFKKKDLLFPEKNAYQKSVTPKSINTSRPHQFFPR